ncbi:uncharacterized protein MYCFIDRAFT_176042 [Pseudocercospora fijiensis CIRAD86]|uniref:Uncharacterized protein n=1 Tax=Pseudocercospora fijiensis (strain CIRAD86) TaxID=383855 RepID=M3AD70_PSEFD|nr:uncharacterized protein MYCFIDRAFT_176042 [Pseudocercospora fijiensis CIRAD86]EME82496.1 hypothetical protein MYCFIDRAFT_176042 [Pseudocercospora fijiensis CIRAD86]
MLATLNLASTVEPSKGIAGVPILSIHPPRAIGSGLPSPRETKPTLPLQPPPPPPPARHRYAQITHFSNTTSKLRNKTSSSHSRWSERSCTTCGQCCTTTRMIAAYLFRQILPRTGQLSPTYIAHLRFRTMAHLKIQRIPSSNARTAPSLFFPALASLKPSSLIASSTSLRLMGASSSHRKDSNFSLSRPSTGTLLDDSAGEGGQSLQSRKNLSHPRSSAPCSNGIELKKWQGCAFFQVGTGRRRGAVGSSRRPSFDLDHFLKTSLRWLARVSTVRGCHLPDICGLALSSWAGAELTWFRMTGSLRYSLKYYFGFADAALCPTSSGSIAAARILIKGTIQCPDDHLDSRRQDEPPAL